MKIKTTWLVLGIVSLVLLLIGASVISTYNDCVRLEAGIEAQYKANQNNYDKYFKSLKEAARVPEKYSEDLERVFSAAISKRYGPNGSEASIQFLKEQNPNFDASVYRQIQQIVESGRINFETVQNSLIDKKRVYQETLNTFPGGAVARMLGFPKIDLNKIDIVTSADTDSAFDTKKAAPIDPFAK